MGRPRKATTDTPKNGPDPETIASYYRKLQTQADAVEASKIPYDEERGRYRSLCKAAKTDGVDIDQLLRVLKASKQDNDKRQSDLANYVRYARLMNVPLGTQFDLFGGDVPQQVATDNAKHNAKRAGEAAGRRGEHRHDANPHDPASELFVAFDAGWMKAQTGMVNDLAPKPSAKPRLVGGGEGAIEPATEPAF